MVKVNKILSFVNLSTIRRLHWLNLYWLIVSLSWPMYSEYALSFDPIQARFVSYLICFEPSALSYLTTGFRYSPSTPYLTFPIPAGA